MGDVDRLIQGLRGDGAVASRGQFTLDAAQAREKLRAFQLADPHRWVVLVVQALLARGARRVDIAIDTDDVRIAADARAFSADELSDLPNVLLGEDTAAPGLRELALGLNAALALAPRWLRLDSVDEHQGVRLEQRPGEGDRVQALPVGEPGVRVRVKQRLGLGLVARFFRIGGASVREHELLRRHCGFATAEIILDGVRLPLVARDPDVTHWRELVVDGVVRGVVGISPAGGEGRIELLRHQVWMSTHGSWEPALVGVRAVVDVSAMRTDVSMIEVVRDADYDALIAAVNRVVDAALIEIVEGHATEDVLPAWLEQHVATRIAARGVVHPLSREMDALTRVPLWQRLDGARVTTAELDSRTSIECSRVAARPPPPEVAAVIDGSGGRAERLAAVFGERCRDHTTAVEDALRRASGREAFEQRLHPNGLPRERTYSVCVPIETAAGVIGSIGTHDSNNQRVWIRLVHRERLLVELRAELPLGRVHAVIHGELTPTATFDDVVRDEAFAVAMHATLVAYDTLVRRWAGALGTPVDESVLEALCRHLRMMEADEGVISWLGALGIDATRARQLIARLGRPWRLQPAELAGALEHPLLRLPLFRTGTDAPLDLLAIAAHIREHGQIFVIAKGRPRVAVTPEPVVRTDEKRMQLLLALFGSAAIVRAGDRFERWIAHDRFLAETPVAVFEPSLPCALGPFDAVLHGHAARVGVRPALDRAAQVRMFLDGRPLALVEAPCVLPGLVFALHAELEWVSDTFDGIVGESAGRALALAVIAALGVVAEHVRDAELAGPRPRAALVLELARIAWPGAAWLQSWLALGRELGAHEAATSYVDLLRLRDHHDPGELVDELTSYLEQSVAPMPALVAAKLRRSEAPTTEPTGTGSVVAEQTLEILSRCESWMRVPCFAGVEGAPRSLADLVASGSAGARIGHVEAVVPGVPVDALVLEPATAHALTALLGSAWMHDLSPDLRAQERRAEFQRRPQRDGLGLDEPDPLAEVEVEEPLIAGTLGLPRALPGRTRGRVVVCHLRREVCTVDPFDHTSYLGTLDGRNLGAASGFTALAADELGLVRACCERHRGALLRALLRAWGDSDANDRLCAAWIRHLLVQLVPRSRASQVVLAREGVAELAELPLFVDSVGVPMSLAAMREEVDAHGDLGVVTAADLRLGRRLVHARDALELAQLRTLFDVVVDCDVAARARLELERALERAPVLPEPSVDAFARVRIDDRELEGELWLDPNTHAGSTVWLGYQGRAIEQRQLSKMFPCSGSVGGDGVELAPEPGRVRMTRARSGLLRQRSAALYLELIAAARESMPPADDPRARALASLMMRLHAIALGKRAWPSHEQRRCYRELRELPLLALPNGRAISLDVALRERPRALANAGLWDDDGRDLDASDRDGTGDGEDAPVQPEPAPPVPEPVDVAPSPVVRAPEQELARAVRDELRLLRGRDERLFAEMYVERITVEHGAGDLVALAREGAVVLDAAHPVVARALAQPEPLLISLLASAAFTVLNVIHEPLTDEQEARVLAHHVAHLRTAGPQSR